MNRKEMKRLAVGVLSSDLRSCSLELPSNVDKRKVVKTTSSIVRHSNHKRTYLLVLLHFITFSFMITIIVK